MRLLLTFCTSFLFFTVIQAQHYSKEFGKIGADEINLVEYPLDKSAEAVVLFDIGKSSFVHSGNGGFDVVFEKTTRIKILSEAGINQAEIEVLFYQEGGIYEEVDNIEANVYNFEDGKLSTTKLEKGNYHDEKINDSWKSRKFVLPNVKVGSVIEYRYKINSQYVFNLRDWEFQKEIPVMYSEYDVSMIPFYQYTWLLQGANRFHKQESSKSGFKRSFQRIEYRDMLHKYVMVDVPAFKDEEYITTVDDYIIKIDFQLSRINYPGGYKREIQTTWTEMIESRLKHQYFGKIIKKSEKYADKVLALEKLNTKSEEEKFNEVIRFVKANYNWNKRNSSYASKNVNELNKDKFGNTADINLFAIGLLRAVGIQADPIIMSTRSHGKIKTDYPFSHFFNYVIISAQVNGKVILSDATEILSPNNMIPPRCLNDRGLIIAEGKDVNWANLNAILPSVEKTYLQINLSDSLVKANFKVVANRYFGLYLRNRYGEDIDKIAERIKEDGYDIQDSTIKVSEYLNFDKSYVLVYSVETEVDTMNNKIYLSPFLNEPMKENKLKQQKRTYPVDMQYPESRTYYTSVNIPVGYEVDYIPQNQRISNELFELIYTTNNDGANVSISFSYSFKKALYPATVYSKIKYYMNEIVKKGNEKIVFKKI